MDKDTKMFFKVGFGVVVALVGAVLLFSSFTIVGATERSIILRFGEVNRVLEPGLHLKIPMVEKIIRMEVATQKIEAGASAASKDLQIVTTDIALQYHLIPESVGLLYKEFRTDYKSRVIDPAIQNTVKAITAKFNAEELITKRAEVKELMTIMLENRLVDTHMRVTNLDIVNFSFSKSFNKAIEEKVTAEQNALREENKLKQVEFEAKQKIEIAKAEAMKTELEARALAINSNLIQKIIAEAQLKAAERWDGVLPTHMYGSAPIPLINIGN